ncbi:MAG TPA: hypothetical protein VHA78_05725 [Candidatus Peribacteraceae bacterium]|nr:hypothetical protein [Candidatus Peribacteraceae bacterium]
MRFLRLSTLIGALGLLFLPEAASMQPVPQVGSVCFLPLPGCVAQGAVGFNLVVATYFFPVMEVIFGAVATIMFAQYAIRLMLESGEESTISETKSALTYGITGAALVSLCMVIVQTVGQGSTTSTTLINAGAAGVIVDDIVTYMRYMVSTVLSAVIVYQGIRLVLSQGQDSEIEQQKKRFFHALIGVAIMLLGNILVDAVAPGAGSSDIAVEVVGIINYLLVILGGLSVLAFLVAGVFLVVSTDEALKDRAKKTIFNTTVVMIVALCVYAILNLVVALP